MLWTYPRMIHSEVMTHRAFSKNAASSRAIPLKRMIEAVQLTPAYPERWGCKAERGMQDGGLLREEIVHDVKAALEHLKGVAIQTAQIMDDLNVAKQIANRYIEPWAHMTTLVTGTDAAYHNFFALRAHPGADPTFQVLAYSALDWYLSSRPKRLDWGQWHLPGLEEDSPWSTEGKLKMATALACRTSYTKFDEELSMDDASRIHRIAKENGHMSPFEHCAQAVKSGHYPWSNFDQVTPVETSLQGISHWLQYRKMIEGENKTNVDLNAILASKPEWIK